MRSFSRLVYVLILCGISFAVSAADYTAQWSAPTKRSDGTALAVTELGGYEIRYKKPADTTFKSVVIPDGKAVSYKFVGLDVAQYQVSIAAFDKAGVYSDFVAFNYAPIAKPGTPALFKVNQQTMDVVAACLAAVPNCKIAVQGEWQ